MTSLRPLLTPRWALALLLCLAAMVACILLGLWQWHRFEAKSEAVAAITANYDAAPVSLSSVLGSPTAPLPEDRDYTVISARGTYCTAPGCVLYVRNRPLGSAVGFWQLVPFTTADGTTILTVRGWVDGASTRSEPATHPTIPQGEITLTARLRPAENQLPERSAVPGQVQSVNAADVRAQAGELPGLYEGAYAVAVQEEGAPAEGIDLPLSLEKPETTKGPHLSYAFQWWVFSLLFPLGFVVSARRTLADAAHEAKAEHSATLAGSASAQARHVTSRRDVSGRAPRPRSDEEDEDEFLDERNL